MKKLTEKSVTLLELIVVLVIISILSTVAVGVYTKEVLRAKITRTRAEIRTLEVAINRYEIDTGSLPPSGTGTNIAPNSPNPSDPVSGSGYLQLVLRSSLNGVQGSPLSPRWNGPYIEWDDNRLGTLDGRAITDVTSPAEVVFLDPFFNPYTYVQNADYVRIGGAQLPTDHPYYDTETFYNATSFQIISNGPNGLTFTDPYEIGTDDDDITNWISSNN